MREPLAPHLRGFGTTIFAEMSALAAQTGAINLGQGFPDTDGPREVADAAVAAIRSGENQYPPGPGTTDLRTAIAEHQQRFWGLTFDPANEVLVTAGATEAIAAALLALCEPGDEVIALDPAYDSYPAATAMAGAALVRVPLTPPRYDLDVARLRAAITPRTKVLVVNTPHNPTGAVLSRDELQGIADLAIHHDLFVITDEVYEHMVFDGEHVPLAGFPGMRDRTVTVSSAGKTLSFTGWKIGWVCAPPPLVDAVRTTKQFLTYVNGAPFQPAVAVGLRLGDDHFEELRTDLLAKRDLLATGLAAVGFDVYAPRGTYFITAGISALTDEDALTFCRALPARCGVVAVPTSVFYGNPDDGRDIVRFAFCKRFEVLDEAVARLKALA
ncbi:MAG TPA: pyridoxal phosphate-dependent aminotransferase [Acidimicrobiales bacterium]|nr:pyridoxal phosphate-dependent aminotransferase [Acidimicrobiales bacterium]